MSHNYMDLKPNLVHPNLKKKISNVLAPPQEDYWSPAKNSVKGFYQNYIRTNIFAIIVIIIIICILIYRYRITKEKKSVVKYNIPTSQVNPPVKEEIDPKIVEQAIKEYEYQKEMLRKPHVDKKNFPVYAYGGMP